MSPVAGPVFRVIFALLACGGCTALAATNAFYVVESVDCTGSKTHTVATLAEYQKMKSAVALRNRHIPAALEAAKKEWRVRHRAVSRAFPQAVARPETVTSLGLCVSEEAAQAQLVEIRSREEQRLAADAARPSSIERQIDALKDSISSIRSSSRASIKDRVLRLNSSRLSLKVLRWKLAQAKRKQAREASDLREARSIFDRELDARLKSAGD